MTDTFALIEAAQAAPTKTISFMVFINGVVTPCAEVHTSHDVDNPVGTCTLVIPAPMPVWVQLNTEIKVVAGYSEGTATIFNGRIPQTDDAIDNQGRWTTIHGSGWSSLLSWSEPTDILFPGGTTLKEVFRGVCAKRGVPKYWADDTTYPDGVTPIALGGNPDVETGNVVIPKEQSPLDWLKRVSALFGYRIYDKPDGTVRLLRVSGIPTSTPLFTITEGINSYNFKRNVDLSKMFTYWEIIGASGSSAAHGVKFKIRSIPASVPYSPYLNPPGYAHQRIDDDALVSQSLADAARNAHEIDFSIPYDEASWECDPFPHRHPGSVIQVNSPTLGINGPRWLTKLDQAISDQGYFATMTAWAGGGTPLAAGNDCVTQNIGRSWPYHLGDETISWYATPTPDGTQIDIPFTVYNDYTTLNVTGYAHGTNSFFIGNQNTNSTVSKFQIFQGGFDQQHQVGSGDLPVLAEDYAQEYNYGAGLSHWSKFTIPINGSLNAGSATLRIISGKDASATAGPFDDFEIDGATLTLTTCGVGQPVLPTAREVTS